jgi:hypothetical protein
LANVKTIGGSIVNTAGVPLPSKTVTLKNDDTSATITTTTTNADGEWEFANRDETLRYRAEAAFGGSSSQVVVRKPASAEFDHLYANTSFRTAAAATVALGGPLTVAGNVTTQGVLAATPVTTNAFVSVVGGSAGSPFVQLRNVQAPANSEWVDLTVDTDGSLLIRAVTDDYATAGAWLSLTRGGAAVYHIVAGAPLVLPVGAVGTPSLTFAGDTNTGLCRSAEGEMTLVTNGVARLTVAPTGAEVVGSLVVTSGQLLLDGPLTVSGDSTFNNLATFNGASVFNNTLGVVGLTTVAALNVGGTLTHTGTGLGFFNAGSSFRRTVTGAKGGNTALTSLISALVNYGLILDTSTA